MNRYESEAKNPSILLIIRSLISNNSWSKQIFFLGDYINLSSDVQLRFTAEDVYYDGEFGSGGSIVEAAVDDILIYSIGASTDILLGDVNFDDNIDILDIVIIVNFALNVAEPTEDQFYSADINSDGVIDILDIVNVINIIMS